VRTGKQSACTRKTDLVGDTRMVACNRDHMFMMDYAHNSVYALCACARSCNVLLPLF
jgi:hypothetical protein